MSKALDKSDFLIWEKAHNDIRIVESKIEDRINYILREVIHEALPEFCIDYWYFPNSGEYGGTLSMGYTHSDYISLECEFNKFPNSESLVSEFVQRCCWEFPIRFLHMPDEDIIAYLRDECEKLEAVVNAAEEKKIAAKQTKQELRLAGLNKLTKDEKKALGL